MKKIIACISIICYTLLCYSQNQTTDNNYRTQKNISYLHPGEKDSYKLERCKLDLHYPTDKKGFATLCCTLLFFKNSAADCFAVQNPNQKDRGKQKHQSA